MKTVNENSMFVKLDEYKDVMRILKIMKKRVDEAKLSLEKVNQIRKEEDVEVNIWHKSVQEIESRINHIDQRLFEAGNKR